MTDLDMNQQLETPLALLRSIADSAFNSGEVPSQTQLQQQLAQLQGAVSDLLDVVANALNDMLGQFEDDLSLSESSWETAREDLRALSEDVDEHLGALSDALLGARSLAELGGVRLEVESIGRDMQSTFERLASLFDSLLDADMRDSLAQDRHREETLAVAELLVSALDSLDGHLNEAESRYLRDALLQVDKASEMLRERLAQAGDP